jgi:predicted amidohydrolase YtcJ
MQVLASRPALTKEQIRKGVGRAVAQWTANGQTTASELGLGLSGDDIQIALTIIEEGLLPIDLVMFAKESASKAIIDAGYSVARQAAAGELETGRLLTARPEIDHRYINRVRLAGIKFWIDGSIDTCFMSQPFTVNPPGVEGSDYRGMRVDPQDVLVSTVEKYWKSEKQIAAHAIGDEANEQLLLACEAAQRKLGPADHRPIFQHALLLRPDQIERIKKVGGVPSLTAGGINAMGDYISQLFGPEREAWVGTANSFVRNQMHWTIHHDMPAGVSPSLIYAMWNIVNRQTRSGRTLQPNERVTPYEALRALTIHGAYQFKEEKSKGSLEVGKLADLVILDRNPLKVNPMEIKDIKILETIKEGRSVYKN